MAGKFLSGLFGRKKPPADDQTDKPEQAIEPGQTAEPEDEANGADASPAPLREPTPPAPPLSEGEEEETARSADAGPAEPSPSPTAPDDPDPEPAPEPVTHPAAEPASPTAAAADTATAAPATADPAPAAEAPPAEKPKKTGWLSRLTAGLSKTSGKLTEGVSAIFTKRKLDDDTLEDLSDLLITADLGVKAATRITDKLAKDKFDKTVTDEDVRAALADDVAAVLAPLETPLAVAPANRPHVILMTGVNGAGKTTTIGKLAQKYKDEGLSVMLAAGDTFRAAAIEQLSVWGERTGAPVVARDVGADAAGLAFDAVKDAREAGADVLIIDTAGRLQNKSALMEELAKIVRVVRKLDETAPHDVILVLDATVGQNAIAQARAFTEIAGVTGLVMTKLDGTARGGVLVALADEFSLPVHYIGVGEGVDDLQPFRAQSFARALAGFAD